MIKADFDGAEKRRDGGVEVLTGMLGRMENEGAVVSTNTKAGWWQRLKVEMKDSSSLQPSWRKA